MGGIVGRAILIDFASYASENNISYDPMSTYAIPLSTVKTIMQQKNIVARPGDILLMRSGWIKWYEENSAEERLKKITHGDAWIGMEVSEESLEWLWDSRFAAVAGDSIGFEVTPLGCCGKYCECFSPPDSRVWMHRSC
jgi:kynurenine formamidase